jgi:hypothetical protein
MMRKLRGCLSHGDHHHIDAFTPALNVAANRYVRQDSLCGRDRHVLSRSKYPQALADVAEALTHGTPAKRDQIRTTHDAQPSHEFHSTGCAFPHRRRHTGQRTRHTDARQEGTRVVAEHNAPCSGSLDGRQGPVSDPNEALNAHFLFNRLDE